MDDTRLWGGNALYLQWDFTFLFCFAFFCFSEVEWSKQVNSMNLFIMHWICMKAGSPLKPSNETKMEKVNRSLFFEVIYFITFQQLLQGVDSWRRRSRAFNLSKECGSFFLKKHWRLMDSCLECIVSSWNSCNEG